MGVATVKRERLTAADWTEAALEALAQGGLAAVAVEPLAKTLGTTKGSFYWHFADRNALLEATLGLWERRDTDRVIAAVDETTDAVTRLRHLLRLTFTSVWDRSASRPGTVELALQASASHPLVAAALAPGDQAQAGLPHQVSTPSSGCRRPAPATRRCSPTPPSSAMPSSRTRPPSCCRRDARSPPTSTRSSSRSSPSTPEPTGSAGPSLSSGKWPVSRGEWS